jgi:hypothetical protein
MSPAGSLGQSPCTSLNLIADVQMGMAGLYTGRYRHRRLDCRCFSRLVVDDT